jgi:hypothetical protein
MPKRVLRGDGFSIELEQHRGYLRAYVFDGTDSEAVSIAYHRLLGEECARLDVDRLLIVEDLADAAPIENVEAVVRAAVEAGFGRIRTAFVEMQGGHGVNAQSELTSFMHEITVMVFVNEQQARNWLLYGDESDKDSA